MGQGLHAGTQTHLEFIPERTTDFAFAAYSEEHGLIGCLVLMVGFLALIYRGCISLPRRLRCFRVCWPEACR